MKTKRCPRCKETKLITEFSKNMSRKDGIRAYCKGCASIIDKKWRDDNPKKAKTIRKKAYDRHMTPERRLNYKLKYEYGINLKILKEMYKSQGGRCKICDNYIFIGTTLHVDHNHTTGVVRGLLCGKCNIGLGHFYDNPSALIKASKYILSEGNI